MLKGTTYSHRAGGYRYFLAGLLLASVLAVGLPAQVIADMTGHGGMIRALRVSPDGSVVLSASFDHSARLWRLDEQSTIQVLNGHDGPVNDAIFLSSNSIATAGADGQVIIWGGPDMRIQNRIKAHRGRITSLAAVDATHLISGGWDGKIILMDVQSGAATAEFDMKEAVVGVAITADQRHLIAAGRSGDIARWRLSDGVRTAKLQAHNVSLFQLQRSANGQRLLTVGPDSFVKIWDLEGFQLLHEYGVASNRRVSASAVNTNGGLLAVGYLDGTVMIVDAVTGVMQRQLQADNGPVWSLAFTANNRFLLSAGKSERIRVWHIDSGDRITLAGETTFQRPTPWLDSPHPGAALFRKCAICHALTASEPQRSGPHFQGLPGRVMGSVTGYRYSRALQKGDLAWNRENLMQLFSQGPDRFLPGTKMPVQRIGNEVDLGNLIDYLEILTRPH